MNKIGAVLCIRVLLLSGCGGKDNEFVVEGTINNLGGRPIYAVYSLENGIGRRYSPSAEWFYHIQKLGFGTSSQTVLLFAIKRP